MYIGQTPENVLVKAHIFNFDGLPDIINSRHLAIVLFVSGVSIIRTLTYQLE